MRYILLALVLASSIGGDAWAWGDEGHKVICEIAMRLVQPSTRAEIQKLISTDDRLPQCDNDIRLVKPLQAAGGVSLLRRAVEHVTAAAPV